MNRLYHFMCLNNTQHFLQCRSFSYNSLHKRTLKKGANFRHPVCHPPQSIFDRYHSVSHYP